MPVTAITDREFMQFQRFIYDAAGIFMANGKQALVSGRLAKRLAHYQLNSYGDYLRLLESRTQPAELQVAVDLLTTNETYFSASPSTSRCCATWPPRRATRSRPCACGAPPVPAARNRTASPW